MMALFRSRTDPAAHADEDLIELVKEGDEVAFGVLYDRHGQVAYSLAVRLLGDRTAAEDLVQEAFLSAWRSASAYVAARGSVRTWLLSIVHHRGIDRLRSQSASMRRDEALKGESLVAGLGIDTTSEPAIVRAQTDQVRKAMDVLPDEQLQVIRLSYMGGFTHHEIATMLELPLGTVKGRMRLALERLRREMSVAGGVA